MERQQRFGQRRLALTGPNHQVGSAGDRSGAGGKGAQRFLDARRSGEGLGHRASLATRHTRSGVIGSWFTGLPRTFEMALATAPAVGTHGGSPTPLEPLGPASG